MAKADELLVETIEGIFADHCAPEMVGAAEGGIDAKLWGLLEEGGLSTVGLSEANGGSGGTLHDAAAIVKAAGRYAAPAPIAEKALVGGWALEQAGLNVPAGALAVVVCEQGFSGVVRHVPWAGAAENLVLVSPEGVAVAPASFARLEPGVNHAGEPWAHVTLDGLALTPSPGPSPADVWARGALSRALLMAGALGQAVDLSVQYANEREQFGRPIGKFQIMQHYLAEIAGEAAAAEAAADTAVDVAALAAEPGDARLAIAAAKSTAGRAAGIICRISHQIHGAIGFTDEHRLQYSTRRLWSWRDEYGGDGAWAAELGTALCAAGGAALWPLLTTWPPAS
ncbi:MAG: acyl-CoA dehydrogenase family protein [Acidimicrobiales bacterium]